MRHHDRRLSPDVPQADRTLRAAVAKSFNCISVEGHTSTSDTVLLLADVSSGAKSLLRMKPLSRKFSRKSPKTSPQPSSTMPREPPTSSRSTSSGLRTREEAFQIAKCVADSPLVKTAIHGADPNWGRIVSAAGYSGVDLQEENISLWLNGDLLYKSGTPQTFDAAAVSKKILRLPPSPRRSETRPRLRLRTLLDRPHDRRIHPPRSIYTT